MEIKPFAILTKSLYQNAICREHHFMLGKATNMKSARPAIRNCGLATFSKFIIEVDYGISVYGAKVTTS